MVGGGWSSCLSSGQGPPQCSAGAGADSAGGSPLPKQDEVPPQNILGLTSEQKLDPPKAFFAR